MSLPPPDPFADIPPLPTPPEEPTPSAKPGGARERQQRRRQQAAAQPPPPRKAPKQTAPGGRVRMPRLRFGVSTIWITLIAAVVLVILVVVVLGQLRPTEQGVGENAIWAGTEWTYDAPDDLAVADFAKKLRDHDIGTVYAWVSWLQEDGTWRGTTNFPNVRNFVSQFRAAYPEATLYGWVSLPVNGGADGYRLDDEGVQQAVADFSQRVINDFGFDGVYLNVEPVWDGDENFLSLLRTVRSTVGIDSLISVGASPDWSPLGADIPVPALIVPGTVWSDTYKQSVALLSDEIAVMAYNSGLTTPEDYTQWVAYQVSTFANAIAALGEGTHVMIGMPTYDAEPPGHDPLVENITSAEAGYELGLEQAGDNAGFVRGRALYANWTTDEQEWAAFKEAVTQ
ncbi:MAG: hypothetical protein U0452_16520 [Anaerolineae bacterium]